MLITLAFIPVGLRARSIGFVLFRIFDVIKPFPAGRFEALHGGLGVMADDAMAAVYANIVAAHRAVFRPVALAPALARFRIDMTPPWRPLRTAEVIAVGSRAARLDAARHQLAVHRRAARPRSASSCARRAVVGDDRDLIADLCRQALARVDLVVLTGGLGPTDDDLTRDAVAAALGLPLDRGSGDRRAASRARFAARGLRMPEINRRQAHGARRRAVARQPERHGAGAVPRARRAASSCCCPGRRASCSRC